MEKRNESCTDQACNYGRLLALCNIVQEALRDAMSDVAIYRPRISDRYMRDARTAPAHTFPELYKSGRDLLFMLGKRRPDLRRSFESEMAQIICNLDCLSLPNRWSTDDELFFFLGFLRQNRDCRMAAKNQDNLKQHSGSDSPTL